MKNILLVILLLVVLSFGGLLLKIVFFPANTIHKSIDTAYGVVDNTMTAENAIYNYEWFKKREGEIKALYKKEERAKQELDDFLEIFPDQEKWNRDDKQEYSRLRSNLTATGNMLDTAIEDYNAKSGMVNRAIFKDNLPSNLTRAFYTGQKLTNQ